MDQKEKSEKIKHLSKELGFSACGIVASRRLNEDASHLAEWLRLGYASGMGYMHQHFEKRLDPSLLVEGTKSVVVLLSNYYPKDYPFQDKKYKISRYALGKDYHKVIKKKLKHLFEKINQEVEIVQGRYFVDSAPVMERAWAREAGLGWIGKNSLLLTKEHGSYFFISVILLNIELEPDYPINEYCGNCTRCIEACPTQAIVAPKVVDAGKCISYHSIESKESIPENIRKMQQSWIFGCDICQEVCPWNKRAIPHSDPEFETRQELASITEEEFESLSAEQYEKISISSAIRRAGYEKLKDNISSI